ncbi:MAG: helix-turn-helix transcriptional regulator [Syntrophobacteraceae bacterium]
MFGEELKKARKESGLTQEELAARAGLHYTYISLLETNKKSPTLDSLFRICKALGISAASLIARVEKLQHDQERKR